LKKPRSDSRLRTLPPGRLAQLREWLGAEGLSYDQARERLAGEWGVVTSRAALSEFYALEVVPWKYAQSAGVAGEWDKFAEGRFDGATRKRVKQLVFELAASPRPDIAALGTLAKILGDSAKLELQQQKLTLDERRVALLEKKAAQADEARAVAQDTALDETEQLARYRQIFGGG
jgi:hypothetical protein